MEGQTALAELKRKEEGGDGGEGRWVEKLAKQRGRNVTKP